MKRKIGFTVILLLIMSTVIATIGCGGASPVTTPSDTTSTSTQLTSSTTADLITITTVPPIVSLLPTPLPSTKADSMSLRTVQIVFIAQKPKNGPAILVIPIGTGILINDDGYIITANHLLDLREQLMQKTQAEIKQLSIEILPYPYGRAFAVATPAITNDFNLVANDTAHDLALLKLKLPIVAVVPGGVGPVRINFADGALGDLHIDDAAFSTNLSQNLSVTVTGYASDKIVLITKTGKITTGKQTDVSTYKLTDTTSMAGDEINVTYSLSEYYRTDITTNAIFSGSPVYSAGHEEILGICNNAIYGSENTVVIPGQYILDLLRNNNIR